MSDANEVRAIVEQWRTRYEASDAAGMKDLWDESHTTLTYLPTESPTVMTTWQDIAAYYDNVCGSLKVKEWRTWNVIADVISPTSAFAFAYTDFIYESAALPDISHYWEGRISFHFKRVGDRWKIVHYEDSTLMQWQLPLVRELQKPMIEEIEEAIAATQVERALELLRQLAKPIKFGAPTSVAKRSGN